MKYLDSHCHLDRLDLTQNDNSLTAAIQSAKEQGIDRILNVSIGMNNVHKVVEISEQFPHIYATVGIHPNQKEEHEPSIDDLIQLADNPKVVAIGETGLDYFRSSGDLTWQHNRFRTHIEAAKAINKPLVIHCRDAKDDTLRILKEQGADRVGGVMHCFVEDLQTAQQAMDLGFYISFSGIVTFNSAQELQQVAKTIPLMSMLVETDSPYLAPVPYRGKANRPEYVIKVVEKIAELRGETVESINQSVWDNFEKLFNIQ